MQPAAQYLVMSSTAMGCVLTILLVYVSKNWAETGEL